MFKPLFRKPAPVAPAPSVPDDVRVYAIGDVHGRIDLLDDLLERIADDHAARRPKRPVLILLGDLVDRGPESASVIERAITLGRLDDETHIIAGNHEELFLSALDNDRDAMRVFVRAGGRETILSYGVTEDVYDRTEFDDLASLMRTHVPQDHVEFLNRLEDVVEIGDYAFVHAGIRPGIALADQRGAHLRWIRAEFLDYRGIHPKVIVHGHTITDTVDEQPNRIGIDTGAYASGRLTAIGLDGDARWFIDTLTPSTRPAG